MYEMEVLLQEGNLYTSFKSEKEKVFTQFHDENLPR